MFGNEVRAGDWIRYPAPGPSNRAHIRYAKVLEVIESTTQGVRIKKLKVRAAHAKGWYEVQRLKPPEWELLEKTSTLQNLAYMEKVDVLPERVQAAFADMICDESTDVNGESDV